MASGIWPSVSGAVARTHQVDVVANNLANSDTLGFKKDIPTFKEYLANVENPKNGVDVPRGPIKDKDFYPLEGRDQAFVVHDATYTDFKPGNLRVTNNGLDLAIDGEGFFEVGTPSGVRYTRQGSFKLAMDGRLVNADGFPVLMAQPGGLANALPPNVVQPSQGGPLTQGGVTVGQDLPPDILGRTINLSEATSKISISEQGEIFVGDRSIGQLGVAEFQDTRKLRKQGGLLLDNPDPSNRKPDITRTRIKQGMLETSNVNPVEEMNNLIRAHRMFEHDMKSLKVHDELLSREVNDLGKL